MAQCQGDKQPLVAREEGGLVPGLILLALLSLAGHAVFYSTSPVAKVQTPASKISKTIELKQPKQQEKQEPAKTPASHQQEQVSTKILKLEKTITTPAGDIVITEVALNTLDNPVYGEKYGHVIRGTIKLRPEYTEVRGVDFAFLLGEQELTASQQISQINQVGPGQYQLVWAIAADGKNLPTALVLKGLEVPTGEQHFSWQVEWLGWMANSKDDNGNIELSEQQAQPQTIDGQVWQLQTIDYATGTVILNCKTGPSALEVLTATATNDRGQTITVTPRLEGDQIYLPLGRSAFTDNARSIKVELVTSRSEIPVNAKLDL